MVSRQDLKHGQVAAVAAFDHLAFNHSRLAHSTMDDMSLQREVLGLFLDQLAKTRAAFKEKPLTPQERKFLGHNLRGSAAAVGAEQIEELARSWEKVGFDAGVLDALFEQAEKAFRAEIRAFLP
ncbi:MAG: Hpt domain-containing protein [Alphaproteobacteria bacterium]|nr:Hpt domain-containing protein [Alphaproteobacteria bacterium]